MQKVDFSTYTFRCSELGEIVCKKGELTETARKYLQEIHVSAVYGVEKVITSKYFEKGIANEQDGLDMLSRALYPHTYVGKNTTRNTNDYINGEHDTLVDGIVYDIKNAWDIFTFGKASLTWDYEWQLKGYCWLNKIDKGRLFYCLTDMPEHLMSYEEKNIFYKGKFGDMSDPEYIKAVHDFRHKHDYSRMTLEERFKVFNVYFTEPDKTRIINAVQDARLYLMSLEARRLEHLVENKKMIEEANKVIG